MLSFLLFHYFIQTKDDEKVLNPFLYVLAFTTFYVFLWIISAFGVVWYGITMYGAFLLLFTIAYSFLAEYHSSENNSQTSMRILLSFLIFCIPSFYFFQSTIPHYLSTIKNAGFQDYKTGAVSENRALFLSHGEYIPLLFALNIDDSKKADFLIEYKTELLALLKKYNLSEDIIDAV